MRISDFSFDQIDASPATADALAAAWYPELSGSADSRIEQLLARRLLSATILEHLNGERQDRTMDKVCEAIAAKASLQPEEYGLAGASVSLNVCDERSQLVWPSWSRIVEVGAQRVR